MREYPLPPEEGESRAGNANDPGGGLGGLGSILPPRRRARGRLRRQRCRGQGVLGWGRRGENTSEISAGVFHGEGLQRLWFSAAQPPSPPRGARLRGLRGTGAVPGGPLRLPPGCCCYCCYYYYCFSTAGVWRSRRDLLRSRPKGLGKSAVPLCCFGALPALSLINNRSDAVNVGVF